MTANIKSEVTTHRRFSLLNSRDTERKETLRKYMASRRSYQGRDTGVRE